MKKTNPNSKKKLIKIIDVKRTILLRSIFLFLLLSAVFYEVSTNFYGYEPERLLFVLYFTLIFLGITLNVYKKTFTTILIISFIQIFSSLEWINYIDFALSTTLLLHVLFSVKKIDVSKVLEIED